MAIPTTVGDLIRIDLRGRFNVSQEMHNVFYYEVTVLPTAPDVNTLEWLAAGFYYNFFAEWSPSVTSAAQQLDVTASIIDVDQFVAVNAETYAVPGSQDSGTVPGESLPAFVTIGMKYIRPSLQFRHGWKRFSGISEAWISGDEATGAAQAQFAILGGQLMLPIKFADPAVFDDIGTGEAIPVIIRSERGGLEVRPVEFASPLGVVFNKIGSQNSRKKGVGI